mmetsp:Transcript_43071/g.52236  ORF Transcript_43071/g.52236 Transcript_43071/m.52236 type:complete len:105 (+) Transcript_43071:68-382(+)|eukprot:CAMPEP_0197853888 /NCGR_PEP_ID=MMETSP1438-20131217/23608_1 /TAXON_ID=1461541 /ORGANISM="Pterosperma sp., Strain CCMP1384" /LENGTH=104 /DNA_ID=CAMNT_0043468457 /DNA_START=48 /DNA_END=362 /DNA_ORIENTATION=+
MGLDQILSEAQQPIVVFSGRGCPFCRKAEKALADAKLPFQVVDYDEDLDDGDAVRSEIHQKHKHRSVPAGFVKGKFIGGCNDGPESWMGIIPNVNNGEIAKMIQ